MHIHTCVYVCICVYIYIYIYIYTHTHIYTYIHISQAGRQAKTDALPVAPAPGRSAGRTLRALPRSLLPTAILVLRMFVLIRLQSLDFETRNRNRIKDLFMIAAAPLRTTY